MRRVSLFILLSLAGAVGFALPAAAQNSTARQVTVVVNNVSSQPPQPVKAVAVSVMFQDVTDARGVTNSAGQVLLPVSPGAAQQSNLHVQISGAGDLVIYQPPDGLLSSLPATVNVTLLPKGSPALLGPPQIQAMLHRMSLEVDGLHRQNAALQTQANASQQQKPDLGADIAHWAQSNGFSAVQVDSQVQQWAKNIQQQSNSATPEQKALAELALKHYDAAAQLFNQASDAASQNLSAGDAQMQALMAQAKAAQEAMQAMRANQVAALRQLLDTSEQAAGADELNLQYHQATQALESAEEKAQAEYKALSGSDFDALWLRAVWDVAEARWNEGRLVSIDQSLALLGQAADGFQTLASAYTTLGDREEAAASESNLALALADEGERAGGGQSTALLHQATQAYESALSFYTKTTTPQDWARVQNNLSTTLLTEGTRASGSQSAALLEQAAQAARNALEVCTPAATPQEWAQAQVNLGVALMNQATRADGSRAVQLFQQSVKAFESALQVFSKADQPQKWALAENDLAFAVSNLGEHASGDEAAAFFNQALAADEKALEVRTRANLPQEWVQTEINIGSTYVSEGSLTGGEKAMALLDKAAQAYRAALEVETKESSPQNWAVTEVILGNALRSGGENASGAQATALLQQAVEAYQNALPMFSKTAMPALWALTEISLSMAWADESEEEADDKAEPLLEHALQGYRDTLEVFTQADQPEQWAETQLAFGSALMLEGERVEPDKAKPLFDESAQAFEKAFQVVTESASPHLWPSAKLSEVTLSLVSGNFSQCLQQDAKLPDGVLNSYQALARDALKLACAWGAGDKTSARATAQSLLARPSPSEITEVDLHPASYFIAHSATFEPGRASWLAVFTAVQKDSNSDLTTALQQLIPILQP